MSKRKSRKVTTNTDLMANSVQRLEQMTANVLTERSNLINKMFDPRRDLDDECGYPKEVTIEQYRHLYDREGIAERVVSIFPSESWSVDPSVYETEKTDLTEFEETWNHLLKEFNIWHYLERIDELSGIGQFGILLFGLSDGKELREPVDGIDVHGNKTENNEYELLFLRCFDHSLVTVSSWEEDPSSKRFGSPNLYSVKFSDPRNQMELGSGAGNPNVQKEYLVHWTRVLHVTDNRKTSEVFGSPRMRSVYNRLYDLRKLLGGSAEMFWKGAFPGLAFEVNPDLQDADIDVDTIKDEFFKYANTLQRYLAVTGVTTKSLAPQVANPGEHIMSQLKALTITLGVPLRVFLGSEAAHLASSQDQETWNKRIQKRQNKYLTPMLIRPFVQQLQLYGILPDVEEFNVSWDDLFEPTAQDKADVLKSITESMAKYIAGQVDLLVPPLEYLTVFMGLELEQAEFILEAAVKRAVEIEAEMSMEDDDGNDVEEEPEDDDSRPTKKKTRRK